MANIVLDMDSTVFDTTSYFHRGLAAAGIVIPDGYITRATGGEVFDRMLQDGHFMRDAEPFPGAIAMIERLYNEGHRLFVGTHRGYHSSGAAFTTRALQNAGIERYFTRVYVLDPKKTPNKCKFFNATLGHYILVDDNPSLDKSSPMDARSVILRTTQWNANLEHPARFECWETEFYPVFEQTLYGKGHYMAPHLYTKMLADLTETARKYAGTQQLRERLAYLLAHHNVHPDHPHTRDKNGN